MAAFGTSTIGLDDELSAETARLLAFGPRVTHPLGGAAWLGDDGEPDLGQPVYTWITARMAHVHSLGHLLGHEGSAEIADAMLAALTGRLRDQQVGGWFSSVDNDGVSPDEKSCYAHAFVVLAASSATLAGRPGAPALLDEALTEWNEHFYDEHQGLYVDTWDGSFTVLDTYRGINANMHAVEALTAAYDATGNPLWLERAYRICERVGREFAPSQDWRLPEHFTPNWAPLLELNRDRPDDQFKPYGATIGHGLEWARLILHVEAALGDDAPAWMAPAAAALFDRAVADGWSADGADGFVYTTDWSGDPVVRDRMHWVAAEGVAAAAALSARTGDPRYAELGQLWWAYCEEYLIDREHGSWHHQLDSANQPTDTVWPGKPDLYHIVQCTLIPRLPLAPGMAASLAGG